MATDPNIQTIQTAAAAVEQILEDNQATIADDEATIAADVAQHSTDQATIQQDETTIAADEETIGSLRSQLNAATTKITRLTRPWTVYSGLESNALFTADKKIPFEWIQAGNTGNTGGGSALPHGTEQWKVTPGQPTEIDWNPANISPKSDNDFNYEVMPYPVDNPLEILMVCQNFSAKTEVDWNNSQQMEGPQVEYLGGGGQNTFCWSVNPKRGLQYWAGADKWQQFTVNGQPVMLDLGKPTFWMAHFSLDPDAQTFTYDWLIINDTFYPVNITVKAVPIASTRKEFSVAVQLDGKAAAPAYAALLQGLTVAWR